MSTLEVFDHNGMVFTQTVNGDDSTTIAPDLGKQPLMTVDRSATVYWHEATGVKKPVGRFVLNAGTWVYFDIEQKPVFQNQGAVLSKQPDLSCRMGALTASEIPVFKKLFDKFSKLPQ